MFRYSPRVRALAVRTVLQRVNPLREPDLYDQVLDSYLHLLGECEGFRERP